MKKHLVADTIPAARSGAQVSGWTLPPTLWRLLWYGRAHRKILAAAFVCMAVLGATTGAYAYLMGPALRFLFSGGALDLRLAGKLFPMLETSDRRTALWLFPAAIIAIAVIKGLAYLGQFYWMGLFGQRVTADIRRDFFARLCHLSPFQLSERLSGDLLSRFSADVAALELAATYTIASYVKDGLQLLFLIGVAYVLDWRVALGACLLVPIAGLPVARLMRRVLRKMQEAQTRLGAVAGQIMEGLGAIRTIQAFNGRESELARFEHQVSAQQRAAIRAGWTRGTIPGLMEVLGAVAITTVLAVSASTQWIPPDKLVSLLATIVLIYQPVKDLGRMGQFGLQASVAGERVFAFIDTPSPIVDPPNANVFPPLRRSIELKRVSFSYKDRRALDELSIVLPAGKTTALVGPSGAGKSTVASLLLRFERPAAGQIAFDGVDVETATTQSVRSQFALVTQEPMLFSASVAENIRFSRPDASSEEVAEAAKAADAHEFISALPRQYDTEVGERGMTLSAGQRQRICLARAILAKAPVLVLDEATSSLDPSSEREVQASLQKILPGRTALVIAHRLITISEADQIHVLDQGRVVESGSHVELLARGGLYARLWELQELPRAGRSQTA